MSKDLRKTFPNMLGFSSELIEKIIKSIPRGHNQRIMYKCKNIAEVLFYAQKTMDNGWSRTVLEYQIDSGLYDRKKRLPIFN